LITPILNSHVQKTSFKSSQEPEQRTTTNYTVDQFIKDCETVENNRLDGGLSSKLFGSPTALLTGLGVTGLGELAILTKHAKKVKKLSDGAKNALRRTLKKQLFAVYAVGLVAMGIIQAWQNRIIDRKNPKIEQLFDIYGNDTNAKLSDKHVRSNVVGACYSPVDGRVDMNKNYINDPIGKLMLKKYMKHELQHARQFEMIAGLDDGIKKLNYAIFKNIYNQMKNNPQAIKELKKMNEELKNNTSGKYDATTIKLNGAEVNLKKYIQTLNIFIENEDASYEDIPMLIDEEHYKKAIKKHGPLNEQEKIKAEEYYNAQLEYKPLTFWNMFNPFSAYKNNLLEKEARKAARTKSGRLE